MDLLTIKTKAGRLHKINFTFDAQNIPNHTKNEILSGCVKTEKLVSFQHDDNKSLNVLVNLGIHG